MQGAWVRPLVGEQRFPRAVWPKQKKTADGATGALPASAPTAPVMKLSGSPPWLRSHTFSPRCTCAQLLTRVRLCDPVDYSQSGSPAHGTLQARTLEGVVISFSRGSFRPRDRTCISCTGKADPLLLSRQRSHIGLSFNKSHPRGTRKMQAPC